MKIIQLLVLTLFLFVLYSRFIAGVNGLCCWTSCCRSCVLYRKV